MDSLQLWLPAPNLLKIESTRSVNIPTDIADWTQWVTSIHIKKKKNKKTKLGKWYKGNKDVVKVPVGSKREEEGENVIKIPCLCVWNCHRK